MAALYQLSYTPIGDSQTSSAVIRGSHLFESEAHAPEANEWV